MSTENTVSTYSCGILILAKTPSYAFERQFDIYAADILDLYYDDDEKSTIAWLNERSTFYQDQVAADLIDDLTPKQLIASQCMQTYASSRWYGKQFHRDKSFAWELLVTEAMLWRNSMITLDDSSVAI